MPISRICPNCNSYLGDFDNYFCSVCGNELPASLTKLSVSLKIREFSALKPLLATTKKEAQAKKKPMVVLEEEGPKKRRSFNENMTILLSVVVIVLSVLFFVLYIHINFFRTPSTVVVETPVKAPSPKVVDLELDFKETDFGKTALLNFVPSQAVLYIEIADVMAVSKEFVTPELVGLSEEDFTNLVSLVQNEFILFSYKVDNKYYWVSAFNLVDAKKTEFLLKSFEYDNFKFLIEDGYLLVFQGDASQKSIETVLAVKRGQALKLTLNPQYIKDIDSLELSGQARILFLDKTAGQDIFKNLGLNYLETKIQSFDKILETGFNALVVKRVK